MGSSPHGGSPLYNKFDGLQGSLGSNAHCINAEWKLRSARVDLFKAAIAILLERLMQQVANQTQTEQVVNQLAGWLFFFFFFFFFLEFSEFYFPRTPTPEGLTFRRP
jgi:hypothetical protein